MITGCKPPSGRLSNCALLRHSGSLFGKRGGSSGKKCHHKSGNLVKMPQTHPRCHQTPHQKSYIFLRKQRIKEQQPVFGVKCWLSLRNGEGDQENKKTEKIKTPSVHPNLERSWPSRKHVGGFACWLSPAQPPPSPGRKDLLREHFHVLSQSQSPARTQQGSARSARAAPSRSHLQPRRL